MPPKKKVGTASKAGEKTPKAAKLLMKVKPDKGTLGQTEKDKAPLQIVTPIQVPERDEVNPSPSEENRKRSSVEDSHMMTDFMAKPSAAKKLRLAEDDPLEKVIEEIEMEDSNSETNYHESQQENGEESPIPDVEKLWESKSIMEVEESSDSSEEESVPEYLQQNALEEELDFFGNLGDIPDVEEVSLDISMEIIQEKPKAKTQPEGPLDMGQFVNPLTGEITSSEHSLKEPILVKEVPKQVTKSESFSKQEEEEQEDSSDQESIDIPILSDHELDVEAGITQKLVDEDEAFNQFLEFEAQAPIVVLTEFDAETAALEEYDRLVSLHTQEFICDLIERAVEKAEYIDPLVVLRQNLDKSKLLQEIQQQLAILEVERRGKDFLNRKCVEYFRRKRMFRPILEENPKTRSQELKKYYSAASNLDQWLIKEQELKSVNQQNLSTLKEELRIAQERCLNEISTFESMVKKTLQRENFDRLQVVVANALGKMNAVRKEISSVRFRLIEKQHQVATLMEKLNVLEDLGNGLSMRNFESLQTETQTLGKKIEERNTELNKLRHRCYSDIHRKAHQREKQKMLHDSLTFQRQYLADMQNEKQKLREHLFRLKIKKSQLRKHIRNISFQSGLLDKPNLMKDYDERVEYLKELQDRVKEAKTVAEQLERKISILESQCDLVK